MASINKMALEDFEHSIKQLVKLLKKEGAQEWAQEIRELEGYFKQKSVAALDWVIEATVVKLKENSSKFDNPFVAVTIEKVATGYNALWETVELKDH